MTDKELLNVLGDEPLEPNPVSLFHLALHFGVALLLSWPILIFLLLKPIFARGEKPPAPYCLDPKEEPLFFSYLSRLAELMGSPVPKQIYITEGVETDIVLRHGWRIPLGKIRFSLKIGLTLAKGLSLAEFTGILAGEMGNLSPLARLLQKVTQNLPRPLVGLGQAMSFFSSRQMEYNADRWHARIVGCTALQATHEKLALLGFYEQYTLDQISQYSCDGILIDDLSQFTVGKFQRLDPKQRESILKSETAKKTDFLSIQPSFFARLRSVREELGPDYPGRVQLEVPAARLFHDLDALSQEVTQELYKKFLGEEIDRFTVRSAEELLAHEEAVEQASKEWAAFSLGHYQPVRYLALDAVQLKRSMDTEASTVLVKKSRETIAETYAHYDKLVEAYDENDDHWNQLLSLQNLYTAGFSLTEQVGRLYIHNSDEAKMAEEKVLADRATIVEKLMPFEQAIRTRLAETFSLLHDPSVGGQIAGVDLLKAEVEWLLEVYRALQENFETMLQLRNELNSLLGFPEQASSALHEKPFQEMQQRLEEESRHLLKSVCENLRETPYPFEHPKGEVSFVQTVMDGFPEGEGLESLKTTMGRLLTAESDLRVQILGRLATIARQVEETLGLPPVGDLVADGG